MKNFLTGLIIVVVVCFGNATVFADYSLVVDDNFDLVGETEINEDYNKLGLNTTPAMWGQSGTNTLPASYLVKERSQGDNYVSIVDGANTDRYIRNTFDEDFTGMIEISVDLKQFKAHNSSDAEQLEFRIIDKVNDVTVCGLRITCMTAGTSFMILKPGSWITNQSDFVQIPLISDNIFFNLIVKIDTENRIFTILVDNNVLKEYTISSGDWGAQGAMSIGAADVRSKMFPGNEFGIDNLNVTSYTEPNISSWYPQTADKINYQVKSDGLSGALYATLVEANTVIGDSSYSIIKNFNIPQGHKFIEVDAKVKFQTDRSGEDAYTRISLLNSNAEALCQIMINNDNRVANNGRPRIDVINAAWNPHPIPANAVQNNTYTSVKIIVNTTNNRFMTIINGIPDSEWRLLSTQAGGQTVSKIAWNLRSSWGSTNKNNFYLDDVKVTSCDIMADDNGLYAITHITGDDGSYVNETLKEGVTKVTVSALNMGNTDRAVTPVIVVYNQGVVEKLEVFPQSVVSKTAVMLEPVSIEVSETNGRTAQVFLWSNLDSMLPLLSSQSLTPVE